MKKKLFLLMLPFCIIFSLWFSSCEEEQVTDLWEKLRNTAWSKDSIKYTNFTEAWTDAAGRRQEYSFKLESVSIGFYGPLKGPFGTNILLDNDVSPYAVTQQVYRLISGNPPTWWTGVNNVQIYHFPIQIDRTGNRIISSSLDSYSNISVSNGVKLTVGGDEDNWSGLFYPGTYTKVSDDPNYIWVGLEK